MLRKRCLESRPGGATCRGLDISSGATSRTRISRVAPPGDAVRRAHRFGATRYPSRVFAADRTHRFVAPRLAPVRPGRKTDRARHCGWGMPGTCRRRLRHRHVAAGCCFRCLPGRRVRGNCALRYGDGIGTGPGSAAPRRSNPPHRGDRRHRLPCQRLGEEVSGLQ